MISKVKRSFPLLIRYTENKTNRKFKTKPKLIFREKGRIAVALTHKNTKKQKIYISKRLCKKNPTFAKSAIVHECVEALTHNHKKAKQIQNAYLKSKGTSYRKEIRNYQGTKKKNTWRVLR